MSNEMINLLQRKAAAVQAANALIATAEAADRDFTAEELAAYDGYKGQIASLNGRIARMEENAAAMGATQQPVRTIDAPAYNKLPRGDSQRNAFHHWMKTGDKGGLEAANFRHIDGYSDVLGEGYTIYGASNATDMNIGTAADGGDLVPVYFYDRIIARRDELSLLSKVNLLDIPVPYGNVFDIPVDNEDDGEFVATNEAQTFDLDAPAVAKKTGTLVLYSKYTDISFQLLRSTPTQLENFLVNWVGRGYAKTLNNLILTEVAANGTALKTFASASAVAFGELEDIVGNDNLSAYLEEEDAVAWVMRSSTHWDIKSIVGNDRQYAVNESGGRSLLGYPVAYSAKAAATAASAKDIFFGNWQYVAHGHGNSLTFIRDPYTVAVKGQLRLIWFFESAFKVSQSEAIGYGVHPT